MKVLHKIPLNTSTDVVAWVVDFSDALEEFTFIKSDGTTMETGSMQTVLPQNHLKISLFKDNIRQYELSKAEAFSLGVTTEQIAGWKKEINHRTPKYN